MSAERKKLFPLGLQEGVDDRPLTWLTLGQEEVLKTPDVLVSHKPLHP